jgi:hypothetical protein
VYNTIVTKFYLLVQLTGYYYQILLGQQEVFAWNRLLGDVKRRVLSQTAAERPLALLHVHRAGSRLLPERLIELIRIPHEHLVPVVFPSSYLT